MLNNRAKSESFARLVGLFLGIVLVTIMAFYLLTALINPVGNSGMAIVILIIISLQISFISAYVIIKLKK